MTVRGKKISYNTNENMRKWLPSILRFPKCFANYHSTYRCKCSDWNKVLLDKLAAVFLKQTSENSTIRAFDRQWDMYNKKMFENLKFKYGMTAEEELKLFFSTMACTARDLKSKKILIAGCGIGRIDTLLAKDTHKIVSLDAGEVVKSVKVVQKTSHLVCRGDILNLPFKKSTFDYVYCEGVLHHLSDPGKGFSELARVTRPQGKLGIYVYPNCMNYYRKIRSILLFSYYMPSWMIYFICNVLSKIIYVYKPRAKRDTFKFELYDTLCCKYLSTHSLEEVKNWYLQNGFEIKSLNSSLKNTLGIKRIGD